MAVAEMHDPQELLRERVAFVMRVMQRSLMGSQVEKDSVRHWINVLQAALDGKESSEWLDALRGDKS